MDVSNQFLLLVPLVLGVVQAIKTGAGLDSRWAPIMSIVLGVIGAMVMGGVNPTAALQGVIAGLSASGLWSGSKATLSI